MDVLFDGRRIFSIAPERRRRGRDGVLHVPWPRALAPYLHGATEVTVRALPSQQILFTGEVVFDDTEGRVNFVDDDGDPLTIDKWGKSKRPFSSTSPELGKELVADLAQLLQVLNEELGVDAFLAYGTLLGGVREGGFIAHDDDADVAYLSRHDNPADVVREAFDIVRALRKRGWHVERMTAGFIQVWADTGSDRQRKIDIFTAFCCGDHFTIERWVRSRLPREAITPLRKVSFEGTMLPVPAQAEDVLEATYGPGWRVPDPSFKFKRSKGLADRSDAWFGNLRTGRWRWDAVSDDLPDGLKVSPSAFAEWVQPQLRARSRVVDLGCGAGDDALWLAAQGNHVVGVDFSARMLARTQQRAASTGCPVVVDRLELGDGRRVVVWAAQLATRQPAPILYARLLLDALERPDREHLWWLSATALRGGGALFLEFRTAVSVAGKQQAARLPMRTTMDADLLAAEIAQRGGRVMVQTLAEDEGWEVCRMMVCWAGTTVVGARP